MKILFTDFTDIVGQLYPRLPLTVEYKMYISDFCVHLLLKIFIRNNLVGETMKLNRIA